MERAQYDKEMGAFIVELSEQIPKIWRPWTMRSLHPKSGNGGKAVVEMDSGRGRPLEKTMGEKI